ncbi:hypothetical protein, partial [Hyphomonas sp.]|uniref:hypothetical protein n=1 Tax=Hyphomonas sp. TaxID=87 RepID=UPI0023549BC9
MTPAATKATLATHPKKRPFFLNLHGYDSQRPALVMKSNQNKDFLFNTERNTKDNCCPAPLLWASWRKGFWNRWPHTERLMRPDTIVLS